MAFEFDDYEIDPTSDEISEGQETYYIAESDYGQLGALVNEAKGNMPDSVSKQTGMSMDVETMSFPDLDAMYKIVAQTCTAEFHKRKGYVDSIEESAITFNELLKLFDIKLHNNTTKVSDIIIELEDVFIYVYAGDINEKTVISPDDFKAPSDDRLILYVLNQEVIDHLNSEKEYRELCETILDRLTADKSKPKLIFHWVKNISRGDYSFSASEILRKLGETGFEYILQFQGVYTYSHTKKSGEIVLRRRHGIKGKQYDVVRLKTIQDFIDYWAWIFKYWLTMRKIPSCDPFSRYIYALGNKQGLLDELTPNPYVGNPFKCSAVILNYNPGASQKRLNNLAEDPQHYNQRFDSDKICGHMAHNHWQVMQSGEYFDFGNQKYPEHRAGQDDGPKWWKGRKEWIDELIPNTNLNPFGLEICGWHSNSWGGVSYNKDLLQSLKNRLAGVIEESINRSALGIGICVGSQYGVILPAFGYNDVSNEVLVSIALTPKDEEKYREYRVFRNQNGTYIINTWLTKGYSMMDVPTSRDYENRLILAINGMKDNR